MTEESKASVPSTIGGSSNGDGGGAKHNNTSADGQGNENGQGRHGRGGKGNGNGQKKSDVYANAAPARYSFKDDEASTLGVMHQHYFDCYDISDQVRFTVTLDKLQQYASKNCKTFGRAISAGIADSSKRPTVPDVPMPQKKNAGGNLIDKQLEELTYAEKLKMETRVKMQIQSELELEEETGVLYSFIFRRCMTLLQEWL
jgi:hypothetical protein